MFNFLVHSNFTRDCMIESCLASQGVENIAQQLGPLKVLESTQTLEWLLKAYEHSHTQLFFSPNHT